MTSEEFVKIWTAASQRVAAAYYPSQKGWMKRGIVIRTVWITVVIGRDTRRSEFLRDMGVMGGMLLTELEFRNIIIDPPGTGENGGRERHGNEPASADAEEA